MVINIAREKCKLGERVVEQVWLLEKVADILLYYLFLLLLSSVYILDEGSDHSVVADSEHCIVLDISGNNILVYPLIVKLFRKLWAPMVFPFQGFPR